MNKSENASFFFVFFFERLYQFYTWKKSDRYGRDTQKGGRARNCIEAWGLNHVLEEYQNWT